MRDVSLKVPALIIVSMSSKKHIQVNSKLHQNKKSITFLISSDYSDGIVLEHKIWKQPFVMSLCGKLKSLLSNKDITCQMFVQLVEGKLLLVLFPPKKKFPKKHQIQSWNLMAFAGGCKQSAHHSVLACEVNIWKCKSPGALAHLCHWISESFHLPKSGTVWVNTALLQSLVSNRESAHEWRTWFEVLICGHCRCRTYFRSSLKRLIPLPFPLVPWLQRTRTFLTPSLPQWAFLQWEISFMLPVLLIS